MSPPESDLARPTSKRLLVVSREFLPSALVAGQRVSAFSKYLPEYGIAVHVVTAETRRVDPRRRTCDLRQLFPERRCFDSRISYVAENIHFIRPVLRARNYLNKICRRGGIAAFIARIVRKPLSAYAFFTYGEHNAWVRNAVREATEIANGTSFDAVFASFGGEYWNLGAASRIAKRLRIPLILDFRDGWDWFFGFSGRRSIIYPMMRRYINDSALVTGATQSVIDRILQFWPNVPVAVVPNGYDVSRDAFLIGSRTPAHSRLRIGHLGTFWANPRWRVIRAALEQLAETTPVDFVCRGKNPERIKTEFAGTSSSPNKITFDIGGLCARREITALYGELDLVLTATPDEGLPRGAIPVKLVEAIGFAKPFIFLADRSPNYMRSFLRECVTPYMLVDDATTIDELTSFILKLKDRHIGELTMAEQYSARQRSHKLTELLLGVMNESSRD